MHKSRSNRKANQRRVEKKRLVRTWPREKVQHGPPPTYRTHVSTSEKEPGLFIHDYPSNPPPLGSRGVNGPNVKCYVTVLFKGEHRRYGKYPTSDLARRRGAQVERSQRPKKGVLYGR